MVSYVGVVVEVGGEGGGVGDGHDEFVLIVLGPVYGAAVVDYCFALVVVACEVGCGAGEVCRELVGGWFSIGHGVGFGSDG